MLFILYRIKMNITRNIKDILHSMKKDGKIILILLATFLITFSYVAHILVYFPPDSLVRIIIFYIPFSFAWLVLAWVITDKSILRTPYPYIVIFLVWFIEKIYWSLFYWIFPPVYNISGSEVSDALSLGAGNLHIPSKEWLNLQMNATYLYIIIEIIVLLSVFIIFWYLSHPSDFSKRKYKYSDIMKNNRTLIVILGVFFMSMPSWLWHVSVSIFGKSLLEFFVNFDIIIWYNFLIYGIPIAIGFVLFAVVITNIRDPVKHFLYLLVFIFVIIPYIPFYSIFNVSWDKILVSFYYSIIYFVSYFFMFLSFVLLSKTKYIEQ